MGQGYGGPAGTPARIVRNCAALLVPSLLRPGKHWPSPRRVRHSGGLVRPVVPDAEEAGPLGVTGDDELDSARAG
jgi:hypothetical protein